MKEIRIDLTPFADKLSLHTYLKEALDFPNYYGANLDALHDELTSAGEPMKITVCYSKHAKGEMKSYIPRILDVFRDAACMNYNLTVSFEEASNAGGDSSMKEVYDFLKAAKVYYLATTEGDQPRVRPFGTVDIFENRLYIQTGKRKTVSMQIHANPKVELCAFMDGSWLRLAGELVQDDRYEAKKHMLDAYPELSSMYAPDDDNTEVLYFQNARGALYTFGKDPKEMAL